MSRKGNKFSPWEQNTTVSDNSWADLPTLQQAPLKGLKCVKTQKTTLPSLSNPVATTTATDRSPSTLREGTDLKLNDEDALRNNSTTGQKSKGINTPNHTDPGAKNGGMSSGDHSSVSSQQTGGGFDLGAFVVAKKKKGSSPAFQQKQKQPADKPPKILLSKEEAEKMRDDLLQHGVQSKNIPKAHAALKQMHESIVPGSDPVVESGGSEASVGCNKAYEEFPEEVWGHVLMYLDGLKNIWALARTCTWLKMVASSAPHLPQTATIHPRCSIALGGEPSQLRASATDLERYVRRQRYVPLAENARYRRSGMMCDTISTKAHFNVESTARILPDCFGRDNVIQLEFPWDLLSSITFAVAKELHYKWIQLQGHFLSSIEYQMVGRPGELVRREKDPEGNKQHLDIIARHIALYERIAQTTATNVWLAMLDEVKQHSASMLDGKEDLTSIYFCRIKANEAAGMLHTALQLGEEALAKKPWTMRDVGMPLAKTIGVPDSEVGWKQFVSMIPRVKGEAKTLRVIDEADVSMLGGATILSQDSCGQGKHDDANNKLRQRWMNLRQWHSRLVFKTAVQRKHTTQETKMKRK